MNLCSPEEAFLFPRACPDKCVGEAGILHMILIAEIVMKGEPENIPDPFLQHAAWLRLSKSLNKGREIVFNRVITLAIITASLAAALFSAIVLGSIPVASSMS